MAVTNNPPSIIYTTDGVSTSFAFPAYFMAPGDLVVEYTDSSDVVHLMVFDTDYTVVATLDPRLNVYASGGTVVMTVAPAAGGTLQITRVTSPTQPAVFNNLDPFPAPALEVAQDRLTLIMQEVLASITR